MRIILSNKQRNWYFSTLRKRANKSWLEIEKKIEVNGRMLRAWRSGKYTIPENVCNKIKKIYQLTIPTNTQTKQEYWNTKQAGRKGAIVRYQQYGNPGTLEGRRKGGLNSLKSERLKNSRFKFLTEINKPQQSVELAEAIGILIGDGGMSYYQIKVSLDLKSDEGYERYVRKLFSRLFKSKVSIYKRIQNSTIEIVVSRKLLVNFLVQCGLPIGNKLRQEIDIPLWIKENIFFSRTCLRGLFDTDGSIYLDKHKINETVYKSWNVAFTSYSKNLLASIKDLLIKEGFHPTHTSINSIRLRRKEEIIKFFDIIGSSNPKNQRKFKTLN